MAYSGYLIKVGTYTVPMDFIAYDSYSVLYSTTDLDSYRDADGVLHRNALEHKVGKVEFTTPYIKSSDFERLMQGIRSQYSSAVEKRVERVEFFIPELGVYQAQSMYVPDITVKINNVAKDNSGLVYEPVRIAFIGY